MSDHQGAVIDVEYRVSPPVTHDELNKLFAASWPHHKWCDFAPVLQRSLAYVCAYASDRLIGFVNVAWDGGIHAFILDTTVHPDVRRRGIGQNLVKYAAAVAQQRGIEWLHVDFEPHLREFYQQCGFRHTETGIKRLNPGKQT
ncbi:MAG: GNAT family N-acetyltransferase [Chloroflexi bacterium]|nr:GNAT family N-acetyltransferase [Chloroflexota bacterium]